jgi:acetyl esterase/lipase
VSAGLGPAVKVATVVNVFGITDVADLLAGEHQRSWAMRWLPPQEGRADLARRLSPLTYVRPDLPPILTLHGDADATVPTEQASRLTSALRAQGVDAELIVVPGAGHGFSRGQWSLLHEQIFAFLRRHAWRGGCQMDSGRTMWSSPLEVAVPIALRRSTCEPR